uniref:Uncharacterized protein n=1 Tax=Octopus bimaculoides TaxID=37653 RepID=A0A0L8GKJ5_OCTBM
MHRESLRIEKTKDSRSKCRVVSQRLLSLSQMFAVLSQLSVPEDMPKLKCLLYIPLVLTRNSISLLLFLGKCKEIKDLSD